MTDADRPRTLVGTGEAARLLGVARTTPARWVAEGRLTPTTRTLGGHLRWDMDHLRAQLGEELGPDSRRSLGDHRADPMG